MIEWQSWQKFTCQRLHHVVHERPLTAASHAGDCVLLDAELCDHGKSSDPSYTHCQHYFAVRRHGPAPVKHTQINMAHHTMCSKKGSLKTQKGNSVKS